MGTCQSWAGTCPQDLRNDTSMICIVVKTGYVMKKNAVATDVTYLLVRVHQTPPNDPSMTGIHFMECQMLSLNAVRTQWVHVNLGLVRVQQDLRNDTSMICIIVKTGYVMKKNAVATDVTYLLVRVHQTPPNDPSMTGIHFMECQMLSLNAVRTQWVHVNLGLVRVQQDLRNDTSMICIIVKTGYVMKKNAVATDVTRLLVRVHQWVHVNLGPPNDTRCMTGIHFMECQMLRLNAVRTQWVHVNLGLVRVQQDLRNDTSMICIIVKTGYVMKKNVVATDVTRLLVRVPPNDPSMTGIHFMECQMLRSECCQNTMGTCQSWAGTCPAGSEKRHEHDMHQCTNGVCNEEECCGYRCNTFTGTCPPNFSKRPEHDGHTFYGMSNAESECCQNTMGTCQSWAGTCPAGSEKRHEHDMHHCTNGVCNEEECCGYRCITNTSKRHDGHTFMECQMLLNVRTQWVHVGM